MQPNIILINCDDLGYGDLGCYGSQKNKTPYIDQLAKEGTLLEEFYMGSPVCSPSRAAMMTGCYPVRVGVPDVLFPGGHVGLSSQETTIASLLKSAGYDTKIIGKWHIGDQPEFLPTQHGFDEYYGLPYSNDMGCQAGRTDKIKFPPLPLMKNDEVLQEQPDQRGLTERYLEESIEYIRRDRSQPFFLYFAHMYVHVPLFVPQRFMNQSDNGAYGGAVECIDWTLGVIQDELKRLGLENDTIIIFTSDNGSRARDEGGSNGILRGKKGSCWEGGQRVPCIIKFPGVVPAGVRKSGTASAIDFLPTLSSWCGVAAQPSAEIDGMDIGAWLEGRETSSPRSCFLYYRSHHLYALRSGPWKIHFADDNGPLKELYHLENDPSESINLYSKETDIVSELNLLADNIRNELGDARLGITGKGNRPGGHVEHPKNLTTYHPDHPYMIAEYDLADMPTMAG